MNKAHCLDFGDMITPKEINDNLGIDIGIVLMIFWGDILMRDHTDISDVWRETFNISRAKVLDMDLKIPDPAFRVANAPPNLSRFLQKFKHCTGEDAEKLHDTLKQSQLKVKGLEIDPNSREVVTVVMSSFTVQLGNWAADHAKEIFKLNSVDALMTAYVRVSFTNEDLEGKTLYTLIKLDSCDKILHENTQEFTSS